MSDGGLQKRTKQFALDVIRFVQALPNQKVYGVIGDQLLRSGTSVGANTRAAHRGRMRLKLGLYWKRLMKAYFGWRYWRKEGTARRSWKLICRS